MKIALTAALTLAVAVPAFAQSPLSPVDMFKQMDANKDGNVTKDEAAQMPASVFDSLDLNKDGKLVVDEVKDLPIPSGPPAGGPPAGGAPPQR